MFEKEITIAGKTVGVAYCYATEIAFYNFTGVNIENFDAANPSHTVYLILAAIIAYYGGRKEKEPVTDEDILRRATPREIVDAVKVIMELFAGWHELPKADAEELKKETGDAEKN